MQHPNSYISTSIVFEIATKKWARAVKNTPGDFKQTGKLSFSRPKPKVNAPGAVAAVHAPAHGLSSTGFNVQLAWNPTQKKYVKFERIFSPEKKLEIFAVFSYTCLQEADGIDKTDGISEQADKLARKAAY